MVSKTVYDRLARWYDFLSESSEGKYKAAGIQLLQVQPGENVLEVGFGTGSSLLPLAQAVGPSGSVWGVDLSAEMAQVAQKKLAKATPTAKPILLQSDTRCLPLAGSRVEAVFSSFTIELFSDADIQRVLLECQRVLCPGGRICIVCLATRPGKQSWMVSLYERLHQAFPAVIDCHPIPIHAMLLAAGFQVIQQKHFIMWGLPVDVLLAQKRTL